MPGKTPKKKARVSSFLYIHLVPSHWKILVIVVIALVVFAGYLWMRMSTAATNATWNANQITIERNLGQRDEKNGIPVIYAVNSGGLFTMLVSVNSRVNITQDYCISGNSVAGSNPYPASLVKVEQNGAGAYYAFQSRRSIDSTAWKYCFRVMPSVNGNPRKLTFSMNGGGKFWLFQITREDP